ncbi:MAG: hypothetical protein A2V88_09325 [Elusimicrobia bacterium RBG_16_66_12]|nr:MAG: hypothetical protein A2V88_09325 [Elusimicrobia bacterium RBG_16_66_12]
MKTGQTLQEVAAEIERQRGAKKDYLAPTSQLELQSNGELLRVNGKGNFELTGTAHGQIAQHIGIPQKYYDKMKAEAPGLLASNVNHWLHSSSEARMVRTLDGKARAVLSRRYRPLDYSDLAEAVLPEIIKAGCRVESVALTDSRLYIKAVTERLSFEVKKGDVVQAGIVVLNSEVGMGSVKVEPMIFRLVCTNGMIVPESGINKYHVGRAGELGSFVEDFLRDETREADDRALWMKVQDVVRGAFRRDIFEGTVKRLQEAGEKTIEAPVEEVVERAQKRFLLSEVERSGVLQHLILGQDLSQFGLVQAITRTAQDAQDYDRATDLERLGGQVLELGAADWKALSAK